MGPRRAPHRQGTAGFPYRRWSSRGLACRVAEPGWLAEPDMELDFASAPATAAQAPAMHPRPESLANPYFPSWRLASAATQRMHDLDPVAFVEGVAAVRAARDDGSVDLDRDP